MKDSLLLSEIYDLIFQQQREHMFLRARQEPEMAIIDRNAQSSQFLANKPPPGPSYGRGRDEVILFFVFTMAELFDVDFSKYRKVIQPDCACCLIAVAHHSFTAMPGVAFPFLLTRITFFL